MAAKKWVYLFNELEQAQEYAGDRDGVAGLLGNKGVRLAQMSQMRRVVSGLRVPPGFIITTEACNAYSRQRGKLPEDVWQQTLQALNEVDRESGRSFGDPARPLLLSVRSGAEISMPGMLDTVLNVGLNDSLLEGLTRLARDEGFAYDTYRRFIAMFGEVVLGVSADQFEQAETRHLGKSRSTSGDDLGPKVLKEIVEEFKDIARRESGADFPDDPHRQLRMAIEAVFDSWHSERAAEHRNSHGISHALGTAATVQAMVFGNIRSNSAAGVVFSRNQVTGEQGMYGEYLLNAQGQEIVSGNRTPLPIRELAKDLPAAFTELKNIVGSLERHYKAVQDVEFTVEQGTLWILQTRDAKPGALAAVKMAVHMAKERIITRKEAAKRIKPGELDMLTRPRFDPAAKEEALARGDLIARGIPASPGAAVGVVAFDAHAVKTRGGHGESIVLVRPQARPEDVEGIIRAQGVVASRGGASSHAALIARELNKPCVVGCHTIEVDVQHRVFQANDRLVSEGDVVSVDGGAGEVFLGELKTVPPEDSPELREFLSWLSKYGPRSVWANAVSPVMFQRARELRQKARRIIERSRWTTQKAKVVELLGQMIPEEFIIKQVVVDARNRRLLREYMLDAVRQRYWTGPRTCYYPDPELGKARWQMAINTVEEVDDFLADRDYRIGTVDASKGSADSGGYPAWIKDDHLREIIVPYDPPRKGLKEFEDEHFVLTVSCHSNPDHVLIELNLGTAQLRSLEDAEAAGLIHITMRLDPDSPGLQGARRFAFGRGYLMSAKTKSMHSVVSTMKRALRYVEQKATDTDRQPRVRVFEDYLSGKTRQRDTVVRDICRHIYAADPKLAADQVDDETVAGRIVEAMRSSDFTLEMYKKVVQRRALMVARKVSETIFDEWWRPPFGLPVVMQALDEAAGLHTLEVQGQSFPGGEVGFILVYGAKGLEEASAKSN